MNKESIFFLLLIVSSFAHAEEIQVGIYQGGFPPYYFDSAEKGGIYVDILKTIEARTDLEFTFNWKPMARIEKEFADGEIIHMETGLSKLWRPRLKGKGHYWSDAFINYAEGIFIRKSYQKSGSITADLLKQASDMKNWRTAE